MARFAKHLRVRSGSISGSISKKAIICPKMVSGSWYTGSLVNNVVKIDLVDVTTGAPKPRYWLHYVDEEANIERRRGDHHNKNRKQSSFTYRNIKYNIELKRSRLTRRSNHRATESIEWLIHIQNPESFSPSFKTAAYALRTDNPGSS